MAIIGDGVFGLIGGITTVKIVLPRLRQAPTIADMTKSFMSQSPAWMAAIVNGTFSHTMELTHCTADSPSHNKHPMPTAPTG
jgi:hypothetical protein